MELDKYLTRINFDMNSDVVFKVYYFQVGARKFEPYETQTHLEFLIVVEKKETERPLARL